MWITGTLQDGTTLKPKSLNTRNWGLAAQRALEMEAGTKAEEPKVTVADAIKSFQTFKEKKSIDTKRKNKLATDRLQKFLEQRSIFNIRRCEAPRPRRVPRSVDRSIDDSAP